ncbi:hypothetical protein C8J57DRAFT_1672222 [Mycena rebaudengoi]|nr:hypothetical protein C8J57DRAFT_1672222 [Mycena rebaudengoi]
MDVSENPRPPKRARITPPLLDATGNLLLSLPALLQHPPTHPLHAPALCVALLGIRRCLGLPNPHAHSRTTAQPPWTLSPTDECRARCALAELGLCVLEGGFGGEPWAEGLGGEVEKAAGKARPAASAACGVLPCASTLLFLFLLPSRLSASRALLHIWHMGRCVGRATGGVSGSGDSTPARSPLVPARSSPHRAPRMPDGLMADGQMRPPPFAYIPASDARALTHLLSAPAPLLGAPHAGVALLARVVRLRALVGLGRWGEVGGAGGALAEAEAACGIWLSAPTDPPLYASSPFHAAMAVHVLVLGVVWYATTTTGGGGGGSAAGGGANKGVGATAAVSARLTLLYALLDAGVYNGKNAGGAPSEGVLEVPLAPGTPPLRIRTTHPRVLYALGYFVSVVARKDLEKRKTGTPLRRRRVSRTASTTRPLSLGSEGDLFWEPELGTTHVATVHDPAGAVDQIYVDHVNTLNTFIPAENCSTVNQTELYTTFGHSILNFDSISPALNNHSPESQNIPVNTTLTDLNPQFFDEFLANLNSDSFSTLFPDSGSNFGPQEFQNDRGFSSIELSRANDTGLEYIAPPIDILNQSGSRASQELPPLPTPSLAPSLSPSPAELEEPVNNLVNGGPDHTIAPRDIDLDLNERNIISGKRQRTQSTRAADAAVSRPAKRGLCASSTATEFHFHTSRRSSEFDEAERMRLSFSHIPFPSYTQHVLTPLQTLDAVIAHALTHALFHGMLAHRVTLLHAQLAHALGRAARRARTDRARGRWRFLWGCTRRGCKDADGGELQVGDAELARMGHEVAAACRGLGGAMRAVGGVLEGVLTGEILKAKCHLKNALAYATQCQDNHLRALILTLIAAHYLHTAGEQAQKMLATCEQLAAGLGAPGKKGKERPDTVGNAPLRLWIGERFLELHKRDGREDLVRMREEANVVLRQAVDALAQRGR